MNREPNNRSANAPQNPAHAANSANSAMQRWLRCVLAVVLAATVARTWLGPEPLISTAQAQIPDSGMQRKQLLDETRRTNQLLTELVALLKSGTVKVRVVDADNNSAPQRDQRRR